ncbi:DUF943 family protein [Pluralibacter gergoviae]
MFKHKRIVAILVILITAYCMWIAVRPTKVVRVDNGAIFVEYLPLTTEGKLNWWLENSTILQSKYNIITVPNNFTVLVMNFDGYEKLPKGTREGSIDDYTCFDDTNGEHKKCVYNSIAFVVRGSLNGKVFITIDGKTYRQLDTGKAVLYKSE